MLLLFFILMLVYFCIVILSTWIFVLTKISNIIFFINRRYLYVILTADTANCITNVILSMVNWFSEYLLSILMKIYKLIYYFISINLTAINTHIFSIIVFNFNIFSTFVFFIVVLEVVHKILNNQHHQVFWILHELISYILISITSCDICLY